MAMQVVLCLIADKTVQFENISHNIYTDIHLKLLSLLQFEFGISRKKNWSKFSIIREMIS